MEKPPWLEPPPGTMPIGGFDAPPNPMASGSGQSDSSSCTLGQPARPVPVTGAVAAFAALGAYAPRRETAAPTVMTVSALVR
jgi:hypothetical protein